MKQKYTLNVANSQINIVTEQSKEEIDAIVGVVDRRIREIHLHSRTCSRTDAAILLCLEYCAEKMELQKTIRSFNSQVERLNLMSEAASREMAALQSFPDDFIFKGNKKWQLVQIGNAVPPLLGKAIGLAVKKALDEK